MFKPLGGYTPDQMYSMEARDQQIQGQLGALQGNGVADHVPNVIDVLAISATSAALCAAYQFATSEQITNINGIASNFGIAIQTGAATFVAESANWAYSGSLYKLLPESLQDSSYTASKFVVPPLAGVTQAGINQFTRFNNPDQSLPKAAIRGAAADFAARSLYNYVTEKTL